MKTLIKINGRYAGYIRPHGQRWLGKPAGEKKGRIFDQANEAAKYVRSNHQPEK